MLEFVGCASSENLLRASHFCLDERSLAGNLPLDLYAADDRLTELWSSWDFSSTGLEA